MKKMLIPLIVVLCLYCRLATSQIQYFGYVYGAGAYLDQNNQLVETTTDLPITSPYTNFSTTDGVCTPFSGAVQTCQSLVSRVNTMKSYGVKAFIDLGKVLWCSTDNYGHAYLCPDYNSRWQLWVQTNSSVLNPGHVAGFNILSEGILYGIPRTDIETAAHLVKTYYSNLPTSVIEASVI